MKSALKLIAVLLVGFAAGASFIQFVPLPSFSGWYALTSAHTLYPTPGDASPPSPQRPSVTLSNQVFIESDVPTPTINSISGRTRFLDHPASTAGTLSLGYIVTLAAAPIDPAKLPAKYRETSTIDTPSGPLTTGPTEQALYSATFTFQLLDRDGFELQQLTSESFTFQSGCSTTTQGKTKPGITTATAAETKSVTVHLNVEECITSKASKSQAHK